MWARMVREGGPFPLSRIVLQKLDLVPGPVFGGSAQRTAGLVQERSRPLWRRGNQRCFGSSVPTWTLRRDGLGISTACLVFRLDAFGLRISKSCLHDVDLVS